MGWHASREGGEVLDGVHGRIPCQQIQQPYNITCTFSYFHLQNIIIKDGKDELSLETI